MVRCLVELHHSKINICTPTGHRITIALFNIHNPISNFHYRYKIGGAHSLSLKLLNSSQPTMQLLWQTQQKFYLALFDFLDNSISVALNMKEQYFSCRYFYYYYCLKTYIEERIAATVEMYCYNSSANTLFILGANIKLHEEKYCLNIWVINVNILN